MVRKEGVILKSPVEVGGVRVAEPEVVSESVPVVGTSQKRVSELKAQGYVLEGNLLKAPERSYTSYWDRDPADRQTGTYSPHVLELDPSGRIIREVTNEPRVIEQSSTGGWAIREIKETQVKTYDYAAGEVTTARPDVSAQTFLATSQIYGSDVPVGRQPTSAELQILREQAALPTEKVPVVEKAVPTPGQFPTGISPEGQVLYGYAPAGVRIVAGAELPGQTVRDIREFSMFGLYAETVRLRTEELRQAGVTTALPLFPRQTQLPVSQKSLSQEYVDKQLFGFAGRIEESQLRQQQFFESPGFERISRLAKITTFGGTTPTEERGFVGQTSEKVMEGLLGWPIALGGGVFAGFENIAATGEALLRPETRKFVLPELRRAGIETAKIYDPRTPTGAATFITAGLFAGFAAGLPKSTRFVKAAQKELPPVKGRVFYGQKETITTITGEVVKIAPDIKVVTPDIMPVETRIIRAPREVLTSLVGESRGMRYQIIQLPTGKQFATIAGRGRFKGYYLRTTTDPTGVSKTTIFRGDKPLKSQVFISEEKALLAEARPRFLRETELKASEATIRARLMGETAEILPGTREGITPSGRIQTAVGETVGVVTKVPRAEIIFEPGQPAFVEFGKTQFELVDYPVKPEQTIFERTRVGRAKVIKPVEFVTTQEVLVKRFVEIEFGKLGKPPRAKADVFERAEPTKTFNEFLKENVPYEWPKPEPYTGKPAKTVDIGMLRELQQMGEFGDLQGARQQVGVTERVVQIQRPKPLQPRLREIEIQSVIPESLATKPFLFAPMKEVQELKQFNITEALKQTMPETRLGVEAEVISLKDVFTLQDTYKETTTENLVKTMTEQRVLQQTMTETITQTMTQTMPTPPVPAPPITPPPIIPLMFQAEKKKQKVYDVLVRESQPKGKAKISDVKVNIKALPYNKALNKMDEYVDETTARTGRLIEKKKQKKVRDDPFFYDAHKYRKTKGASKINPKSFIEKSRYAIDSIGEVMGIPLKAAEERKRRGGMMF